MSKILQGLLVIGVVLTAVYLLASTDHPVSRLWQKREADRWGFVRPAVGGVEARYVDLEAFRAAQQQCTDETDQQVLLGKQGCRRCMVEACLKEAGKRYHNARGTE